MADTRMAPEERRAHLRDCAIACFSAQGYHATSVADIVKAAGVAQGTFYNYFESKRAIFDDLLDGLLAEIKGAALPVRLGPTESDPLQQLRENAARVLAVLWSRAGLTKLLVSEAVGLDPEADEKLLAFYGQLLALIEKALDWGQKLGLSRGGDLRLQARMVLGSVKEVVYQCIMAGERTVPQGLAAEILDYNLNGLLTPAARAGLEALE